MQGRDITDYIVRHLGKANPEFECVSFSEFKMAERIKHRPGSEPEPEPESESANGFIFSVCVGGRE